MQLGSSARRLLASCLAQAQSAGGSARTAAVPSLSRDRCRTLYTPACHTKGSVHITHLGALQITGTAGGDPDTRLVTGAVRRAGGRGRAAAAVKRGSVPARTLARAANSWAQASAAQRQPSRAILCTMQPCMCAVSVAGGATMAAAHRDGWLRAGSCLRGGWLKSARRVGCEHAGEASIACGAQTCRGWHDGASVQRRVHDRFCRAMSGRCSTPGPSSAGWLGEGPQGSAASSSSCRTCPTAPSQ